MPCRSITDFAALRAHNLFIFAIHTMIRMYISSDLGLRNATEINPKAYFSGCGMHCVLCIRINSGARYHRVTTYLVIGPRPQRACSVFAVRLQCILMSSCQSLCILCMLCLWLTELSKCNLRFLDARAENAVPNRNPWSSNCSSRPPEYSEASGTDACSLDLTSHCWLHVLNNLM